MEVADAEVKAAKARLDEAKAILAKYEAEVKRWDVQVKRLAREVERQVVAPQILLESRERANADIAARDAAQATIKKADAELLAAEAETGAGRRQRRGRPRRADRGPRARRSGSRRGSAISSFCSLRRHHRGP